MAYYLIEDSTLIDIGNTVREKTGKTNTMTPYEMANAIRNINTGSNSGSDGDSTEETLINYISKPVHIDSISQGAFVTFVSGNSFIANNYNSPNLFVGLIANNLDSINYGSYSNCYQWTSMFASNKAMTANSSDTWYGVGIYSMVGKSQSYSSTLQIPYSLNNTLNTNYSFLNTTSNGDIRIYICSYDVLASGDYIVVAGLF